MTTGPALEAFRQQKNEYFLSNNSPLNESGRRSFTGLIYFAEDSSFRFVVKLIKNSIPNRVNLVTSKGTTKSYQEYGYVEFQSQGNQRLTVYKADPPIAGHEQHLFVPFKDLTNGRETYPSGRYLDLSEDRLVDGWFSLDFNLAYNPWCAYSEEYNCPYPPQVNHLRVPIFAGERMPQVR